VANSLSSNRAISMKPIEQIAVIGLGTLGVQIAIQAAAYGYDVDGFDPDSGAFARMQIKVRDAMRMVRKGPTFPVEQWEQHARKVRVHDNLASAIGAADLVIEVVPEDLETKRRVFSELDRLAPRHALLATNSSSIPISRIESATRRPENCLNIHFYQPAVGMNMADIMGGTRTSPEALSIARNFVSSVGCVSLPVQKEILGFCFNSVWRAVKRQSLYMWAGGFVDFRDIDRAWMVFTGMTYGPFFLMDLVGLDVILAIEGVYFLESNDPRDEPPIALKEKIARGELGVKAGKGFYIYPDPECAREGFLMSKNDPVTGRSTGRQ
jgi:3-hydroxybutyryl-CoA dehydrogenase